MKHGGASFFGTRSRSASLAEKAAASRRSPRQGGCAAHQPAGLPSGVTKSAAPTRAWRKSSTAKYFIGFSLRRGCRLAFPVALGIRGDAGMPPAYAAMPRSGLAPGPLVHYPAPTMPVATPAQYRAMLDAAQKGGYAYPAINITSLAHGERLAGVPSARPRPTASSRSPPAAASSPRAPP